MLFILHRGAGLKVLICVFISWCDKYNVELSVLSIYYNLHKISISVKHELQQ